MHTPANALPGRLRLRFTQLKQQTEQLGRMAAAMRAIEGVLMVETSPLTGGFLIHYDALIGKTPLFWDRIEAVLLAHQLLINPRPLSRQQGPLPVAPGPPARQPVSVASWPRPPARQIRSTTTAQPLAGRALSDGRPPAMAHTANCSTIPLAEAGAGHQSNSETLRVARSGAARNARPAAMHQSAGAPRQSPGPAAGVGAKLARALAAALVDKLIERSAIVLVAALL